MTTDNDTQDSPSLGLADLAAAFEQDKSSPQQKGAEDTQNTQVSVVTDPNNSSGPSGTTPSSSDTQPLTKEAVLGTLTLDDIKNHPELSRLYQSSVDSAASGMLRGKEEQIRRQVNFEVAKKHFDSLSPDALASELQDPEAAKLYGYVVSQTPAPVDPNIQAAADYYTREIRTTQARLNAAGLDAATAQALDPNLHLRSGGDPEALITSWKSKVDEAIIAAGVAKELGKTSKVEDKSKELDSQAKADESKPNGALLNNGRRAAPMLDFDKNSGSTLLADAFSRGRK